MSLKELQRNWNEFGKKDPFWAILTLPGKEGNRWQEEEFFQTGRDEVAKVLGYVEEKCSGKDLGHDLALDFGCGAGRITQALAGQFSSVYGIDIAPSMIKLAENYNKYADKCHYVLNENDDLRMFPDNHFDFVYTCRVLQHMKPEYALNYIAEFIRIIKPGGIIVMQEPTEVLPPNPQPAPIEANGAKEFIKSFIPKPILQWHYDRRARRFAELASREPKMEMHGITLDKMKAFIKEKGATLIDAVEDDSVSDWVSMRYCVTKGSIS